MDSGQVMCSLEWDGCGGCAGGWGESLPRGIKVSGDLVALWNECDPKETGGVSATVDKVEARGSRHSVRGAGEAKGDKVVTKPSSIGCPGGWWILADSCMSISPRAFPLNGSWKLLFSWSFPRWLQETGGTTWSQQEMGQKTGQSG
jgi:hypothetical protein